MKKTKHHQKGGGSTDYAHSFYAYGVDPARLSVFTLNNINRAPMFNPLSSNTIIPTGTSGVIPTGAYYNSISPTNLTNSLGPPTPGFIQLGGNEVIYVTQSGKKITNPWIAHVYKFAENNGISYGEALKHPMIRQGYLKKRVIKNKSK